MRGKARDILILKRITDFSITGSAALKCRNNGRKFNIYKICHYLGVKSELKKNCLWQPCLLMNRDEMSNLYRGPFKDAPYQVSIHLEKIKM
jgi:hypothetical protein